MPKADNITGGTLGSVDVYECSYCHQKFEMKWGSFINHIRWCKQNPKYIETLIKTKENVSKGLNKYYDSIKGEIKDFTVKCEWCGKEYIVKERECKHPEKKHYFCCRKCANTYVNHKNIDSHNISEGFRNKSDRYKEYYRNRYGKEWDDSTLFISKFGDTPIRYCKYCGKEFKTRKRNQVYCSGECARRARYIRSIEHILPLSNNDKEKAKAILIAYKHSCQFTFGIASYPDEFNVDLIKQVGWYKAKNHGNNLNGVSRDHKYSCMEGFRNLIDPYIISHPANCKLLQHTDNQSKGDDCSISLNELIENIHKWNDKYGVYENKIDYIKFEKLGITFNIMYK